MRIAAIGEVMVELSPCSHLNGELSNREIVALSFAGDTYNSCAYMSRLGLQVEYITRLGDDPYSKNILQRMCDENIGSAMVETVPGRVPGLYVLRNSSDGEREFYYWRNDSPARELFSSDRECKKIYDYLKVFDCVYLSGITFAIISKSARIRLLDMLQRLRSNGIQIAFDSNYRPRLWESVVVAQEVMLSVMRHTDIALLTFEDECLLWGDETPSDCQNRYREFNFSELVIKRGAKGVVVAASNELSEIPVPHVDNVIDTTGAGDSFNAGYLAGRLNGWSITDSVHQGIKCAGIVIRHKGAIIDAHRFEQEFFNKCISKVCSEYPN